jgi:CRP-like cAMP-binding protein
MLDADLTALGPVVVAFVPHTFVCEITSLSARLQHAFRLLHLIDMSRLRNWIVNVGSRDSLARVAHLICEITWRLRAVGIATDYRFPSPFTQSDLAAACAISAVHANRIIQELRRRRILHWQSRVVTILDPETLALLGDFNPDYLGFRSPAGASSQPRRSSATPEASRLPALQ